MSAVNITQVLNGMKLGGADKKVLAAAFQSLVDDLETLRAKQFALCQKLDTAGGTIAGLGTNYTTTVGIAAGSLKVGK